MIVLHSVFVIKRYDIMDGGQFNWLSLYLIEFKNNKVLRKINNFVRILRIIRTYHNRCAVH